MQQFGRWDRSFASSRRSTKNSGDPGCTAARSTARAPRGGRIEAQDHLSASSVSVNVVLARTIRKLRESDREDICGDPIHELQHLVRGRKRVEGENSPILGLFGYGKVEGQTKALVGMDIVYSCTVRNE